jgi:hypothetical protein
LKNEYALTPLPFAGLIASLSDALDIAEHTEIRELRRQVRRLEERSTITEKTYHYNENRGKGGDE